MKSRYFNIGVILIAIFLSFNTLQSQDLHYTQFYNSPLNINPANTGIYNGDLRFNLSLRDQWRAVPVPWFTFSGSVDKKFYPKNSDNSFFAFGFIYNYDRQGSSKLNLNNVNITGSYSRILNKQNIITGGAMIGYASRGFNQDLLQWDSQWDGTMFNGSLPTGENFDIERVGFIESGLGVNYRFQKSTRTKLDVGLGVFHLMEPEANFYRSDDVKLPRRISLNGVASIQLIDELDLQLHALDQWQGSYNELLVGGLAKIYLSQKRGREKELHLGIAYRTAGFLAPKIALQFSNLYIGASYDIDMTEFSNIHDNNGGPEFHLRYIITNVKPLKLFKICPIF